MNNTTTKIAVAFALLAVPLLGTFYMYFQIGWLKGVEQPHVSLKQLPTELGSWKGEGRETDERTFRATQADEVVSRCYTDVAGKAITLHKATHFRFEYDVPHSPMVCYPSNGWTTVQTIPEDVPIADAPSGAPKLKGTFALFEMEGRHEMILFWYQLGDRTFSDGIGLHEAQRELRDLKQWPSLVKVLLSTEASNRELAKRRLIEFAGRVYDWSSQMQNGPTSPAPAAPAKPAETTAAPK
jgi:EpsI family protein